MGQRATTVGEQISLLKERGIVIQNEEKAKENLLDIGYYRLGFYCFPFEKSYPQKDNRTHLYQRNTQFEDVVKLYYLDFDLRNLLVRYITRIEINFRTYLVYHVSNKYKDSPTWFVDPACVNPKYIYSFEQTVYTEKFKENPVIKRHHKHHINDKFAPAWKTIEYMTLGNILILYDNLKSDILKWEIAQHYGITSVKTFQNYMDAIKTIRNTCAHGSVLFDLSLPLSLKDGPAGKMGINKNNLQGAITVIAYMLKQISINRAQEMNLEITKIWMKNADCESIRRVVESCSGYKYD